MNPEVVLKIDALDNTKQALASVQNNLGSLEKSTKSFRDRMESLQPAFKKMAALGTVALGAVTVGANKAITSATNLGESMNAVNVIFGDSADKILTFGETAAKSVGLSNSAFNQLATNTGTVLSNTGKSMDEVATMTTDLAVRAADLASVYNTEVDTAMNAIRSALIGQSEPLRNLGVVMSEAQTKAFALSTGIIEVDREMTEQEKTLARYNFIMAETTKQAGDFANTSESLANKQRILAAQAENLSAKMGELLVPIKEMLFNAIEPLIARMSEWIEQNPELARNIIIAAAAVTAIIAALGLLGLALIPLISAFGALGTVIGAIATPIGGIIALLAVIGASIAYLAINWKQHWDNIKWAAEEAWEWIRDKTIDPLIKGFEKVIRFIDRIRAGIRSIGGKVGNIVTSAGAKVSNLLSNVTPFADGGIVTKPTLGLVGEAGPEAIIPLSRPNALAGVGGGQTFVFNVQGDITDRVKTDIMRDLKRQMRL